MLGTSTSPDASTSVEWLVESAWDLFRLWLASKHSDPTKRKCMPVKRNDHPSEHLTPFRGRVNRRALEKDEPREVDRARPVVTEMVGPPRPDAVP